MRRQRHAPGHGLFEAASCGWRRSAMAAPDGDPHSLRAHFPVPIPVTLKLHSALMRARASQAAVIKNPLFASATALLDVLASTWGFYLTTFLGLAC